MNSILTFIIAHEEFSAALLQTVEKIIGSQEEVYVYSNRQDSLPGLARKIGERIKEQSAEKVVVFVDLKGGSCWNLAGMLRKEFSQVEVVAGVNVPMLISYFTYRDELPFTELMAKTLQDGTKGIARLEV